MKKGFTLAEALITLGIIGVVAAMTIPAVIVNTTQQEYKTGLRKAVSTLNDAIALNIALDGKAPGNYVNFASSPELSNTSAVAQEFSKNLQKHMSVIKSTTQLPFNNWLNAAFYTADGIRYEVPVGDFLLYSHEAKKKIYIYNEGTCKDRDFGGPDSVGPPCFVLVDVNGDKAPNPANPKSNKNVYTYATASGNTLTDIFPILIMNNKAIPYGVAAQRAMYSGDNN